MDLRPLVLDIVLAHERLKMIDPSEHGAAHDRAVAEMDDLIHALGSAVILGQEPEPADG